MNTFKRFAIIAATAAGLLFSCAFAKAQSTSDAIRWFERTGKHILAECGHPLDNADYIEILSTSNEKIVVEITYSNFLTKYTDRYTLFFGRYDGYTYFRSIQVNNNNIFRRAFDTWDRNTSIPQRALEGSPFGDEIYHDPSKKAAYYLSYKFLHE